MWLCDVALGKAELIWDLDLRCCSKLPHLSFGCGLGSQIKKHAFDIEYLCCATSPVVNRPEVLSNSFVYVVCQELMKISLHPGLR